MRFALLLLALNLALVLHELGHLVAAMCMRLKVRKVQLGLGPPLFSFKARGVRYALGSLLVGASVELVGENPFRQRSGPAADAATSTITPARKLVLALAGPLGSALAAVGLLAALHMAGTHVPVRLTVGKVLPGSPAAISGIQPGDRIQRIGELEPDGWSEFLEAAQQFEGDHVPLVVLRGEDAHQLDFTLPSPGRRSESDLGISLQYSYRGLPLHSAIGAALVHASLQVGALTDAARMLLSSPADAGLSPVLDVRQTAERSSPGADTFMRGAAMWCLLLALLHLLPIPPLDGGVALLAAIGLWRKRPVSPAVELGVALAGLLLVLGIGVLWVRQRIPIRPAPAALAPAAPAPTPPNAIGSPTSGGDQPTVPEPSTPPAASGPQAPTMPVPDGRPLVITPAAAAPTP